MDNRKIIYEDGGYIFSIFSISRWGHVNVYRGDLPIITSAISYCLNTRINSIQYCPYI